MPQAVQQGPGGLADFLEKLDTRPAGSDGYAVRIGIVDQCYTHALIGLWEVDDVEYFWIADISRTANAYTGVLNNEPGIVRKVRAGPQIAFTAGDIYGGMYRKGDRIVGNVTSCPILLRSPREQLEYYRGNFGLGC